ncbi:ubiquinol-cytochrome c reductase iron-sulfur subunit [Magnetospira thiophila]
MADTATTAPENPGDDATRRDFLLYGTIAVGAAGTAAALWPFVDFMNPSADVLALASIEVDISGIEEGMSVTVQWRGKSTFIRHRTAEEIEKAVADDGADLRDPQTDAERVQKPEWLILVGICTHLGCIPQGQKPGEPRGEFGGWFCPCHGSHYDTSGRIRKGPAPLNLVVPPYEFVSDDIIKIG